MKCKYCKNNIEKGQQFCPNCGRQGIPRERQKSVSTKVLITFAIFIVLIGAGGHLYLKSMTSSDKTVQNIYNALMNNNEVDFYRELKVSEKEIENRKEFLEYIKKQDMKKFLKKLNANAATVQKDGITKIISHEDGKEIFRLNQIKVLGLYSMVEVVPIIGSSVTKLGEVNLDETEKKLVPVEKLKKSAIYTATMQNGKKVVNLYVIPKDILINELEFTSAFGEEGNFQYEGSFAFFLAEIDGENGVLQDQLSINEEQLVVNKQQDTFSAKKLGDKTIVSLTQIVTSNYSVVNMWMYVDGGLKEIKFNDGNDLSVSNKNVKFIGDSFAQSYTYFNGMGDPDEGIGWTYTTWKWNQLNYSFEKYTEDVLTDKVEYGWERGEYFTKLWNEHENYYVSFPELAFTEDSKRLAKSGMLIKDSIQLGSSIDQLLKENPNYVEHSYYEGGPYYSYTDGFSYFYDENTRKITYILLNGRSLLNSLQEIEELLGTSINSGYDDYELEYYETFQLKDYKIDIRINELDEIINIWFSKAIE